MLRIRRSALIGYALVVASLIGAAAPPPAWPQCATVPAPTALTAFPGSTSFNNTVRAQMWIADNIWWGAFSDASSGIYFYKLEGTTFVKGPLIDGNFSGGLPDTLWNGTQLFVLVYQSGSLARLYKYTSSAPSTTYSLVAGFPVNIPLAGGAEAIALHQDSTGKLWATYTSNTNVHVIWSTPAPGALVDDHKSWNTSGVVLAADIDGSTSEAATITHFGGDKIGVAWSNQALGEIAFRFHRDVDPESSWSPKEVVDCCQTIPGVANDHLSLRAAPDGRLFLVAKGGDDRLHLYTRSAAGTWGQKTIVDPDRNARPTRPTLALDVENEHAYVIYRNSTDGLVYSSRTSLNSPAFEGRCVLINQGNNVTTTKQNVNGTTDLVAAASRSRQIFASRQDLAIKDPPPTVAITSPSSGAIVDSSITVTATASDNIGVVGVQFRLDGENLGDELTSAPYEVSWDTTTASNGSHTLTAIARDAHRNVTTSALVTVTVFNDTTPPTVTLTSPVPGSVSGRVTVSATTFDNGRVLGVQFQLNGATAAEPPTPLGPEDTASPYSVSWDTTAAINGTYTLTAVARDAASNVATSAPVTVTVFNDTTPPTVALTSPAAGSTVSGMITVSATASDDVRVVSVRFQLDGASLGLEDPSAPYEVSWDTTRASEGLHFLAAVARDTAGNVAISDPVTVTVANAAASPIRGFEETVATLTQITDWFETTGTALSGGRAVVASTAGARATFTFTGTVVSWIGLPCPECGIANVHLDGSLVGSVDTFVSGWPAASTVVFKVTGLTAGDHILVIEATSNRNPSSTGAFIVVDAFDVK